MRTIHANDPNELCKLAPAGMRSWPVKKLRRYLRQRDRIAEVMQNTAPLRPSDHAVATIPEATTEQTPGGLAGMASAILRQLGMSRQTPRGSELAELLLRADLGSISSNPPRLWQRVLGRIAQALLKIADLLVRSGASLPQRTADPLLGGLTPRAARKKARHQATPAPHTASQPIPTNCGEGSASPQPISSAS